MLLCARFVAVLVALSLNASSASAQQNEETGPPDPNVPAEPEKPTQAQTRAKKTIVLAGEYGLYSFLVPGKKGGQITYLHDSRWNWEVDYFSGDFGLNKYGVNLVSVQERLTTLKMRKFWDSTFNLTLGVGERRFALELGSTLLDRIPENQIPNETVIEIYRYIWTVGIGNRWTFPKGFTVGADWLEVAIPFGPSRTKSGIVDAIQNEDDKDGAQKVVSYLQYLPTVNVVKIHMGYAF